MLNREIIKCIDRPFIILFDEGEVKAKSYNSKFQNFGSDQILDMIKKGNIKETLNLMADPEERKILQSTSYMMFCIIKGLECFYRDPDTMIKPFDEEYVQEVANSFSSRWPDLYDIMSTLNRLLESKIPGIEESITESLPIIAVSTSSAATIVRLVLYREQRSNPFSNN